MATIDCFDKTVRDVNTKLRDFVSGGKNDIHIINPESLHNLAVAITKAANITIDGSVGYYCAGMIDGQTIRINGSAGWGLAESMLSGTVRVIGSAGNGAAAAIRDGTVIIEADAAARLGVSMKGGLVLVGGNCGYMAGFMGQKGTLIVCGDVGAGFADSMYETVCFVGGEIAELGTDAIIEKPTEDEYSYLSRTLTLHLPTKMEAPGFAIDRFKKVISGRKLWNFDNQDWETWREAM